MSKFIPFSVFTTSFFNQIKYKKIPPILDIVEPSLFGYDNGKDDTM
jgi:hypothetical protein